MTPRVPRTVRHSVQSDVPVLHNVKRQRLTDGREPLHVSSSDAATVLFRHTDPSTKKHTRPPISKLFTSIGLSPEQFLELSAKAKDYMLDESHPERRDTVGIRGKSDSEVIKLKLWTCVQDFLEGEGHGESFFGSHASGSRSMTWPQDKSKIIKALFPLLRRVITNEKQRQYALETRSKVINHDSDLSGEMPHQSTSDRMPTHNWNPKDYKPGTLFHKLTRQYLQSYQDWRVYRKTPALVKLSVDSGLSNAGFDEIVAIMDHHLRVYHSVSEADLAMCTGPCENSVIGRIVDTYPEIWVYGHWRAEVEMNPCDKSINVRVLLHELFQTIRALTRDGSESEATLHSSSEGHVSASEQSSVTTLDPHECKKPSRSPLRLRVTIMPKDQDVVLYKREMLAADTPYLHTLLQNICQSQARRLHQQARVYVHLPVGLTLIEDDNSWADALEIARGTIWLEGQVNVVIRAPT